jgi:hypothetical protein
MSWKGCAADGAARGAHRLRHLGQHFLIFPCRNTAEQRAEHVLAEAATLAQHLMGGDLYLSFRFVMQAGPLRSLSRRAARSSYVAGIRDPLWPVGATDLESCEHPHVSRRYRVYLPRSERF